MTGRFRRELPGKTPDDLDRTGLTSVAAEKPLPRVLVYVEKQEQLAAALREARVEGIPDEEDVRAFAEGIVLADGTRCLPALLEGTGTSLCYVTVMEGKYHQVKRMLASRGKPVTRLRRLSVGALVLEGLEPGGFRELTQEDLCKVFRTERLDK